MDILQIILFCIVGAVVLAVLSISFAAIINGSTEGPLTFKVKKGGQWAGPWWKRFAFWWGLTMRDDYSMKMTIDVDDVPRGTSFKLWGVSPVNLRTVLPWFASRTRKEETTFASIAHEFSYRFVGTVGADAEGRKTIRIQSYIYDDARGSVYGSEFPQRSENLGIVYSNEPFDMTLQVEPDQVKLILAYYTSVEDTTIKPTTRMPLVFTKHFFHARGGPNQPGAPEDIPFTARKY